MRKKAKALTVTRNFGRYSTLQRFYFESPERKSSRLLRVLDSRRAFESPESDFSPGETMSAVIGKLYSPLLSFKTNSP